MLENVFRALDDPDEFFLDPKTNLLYVYPNATSANPTGLRDLSLAVLDKYIIIDGASDYNLQCGIQRFSCYLHERMESS